jgi:hypothetical protein
MQQANNGRSSDKLGSGESMASPSAISSRLRAATTRQIFCLRQQFGLKRL